MKDMQSIDDLKHAFEDIALPPIDVRQDVLQKIYARKDARSMKNKKKGLITVVLIATLSLSVGFASMKIWDLKGPGNVPYSYQLIDSGDRSLPTVFSHDYEQLSPGEALAIMKVKNNSNYPINTYTKPLKPISTLKELSELLGDKFKSPPPPEGYTFKEGDILYSYPDTYAKEMLEESKHSKEEYIKRVLTPTDKIEQYRITYSNHKKQELFVSTAFNCPGKDVYAFQRGQRITKVKVKEFDAVYEENNGTAQLEWLQSEKDGSTTGYCIGSRVLYPGIKDILLHVAEDLLSL